VIFEHLQDKHQAATALTRATWGAIAVGALSVVAAPWIAHPAARLLFGGSAAVMGGTAMALDRQKRKLEVVLKTAEAEGAIALIASLRRELAPARIEQALALPESSDPLPMAQWWPQVLRARFVQIVGPQGSGKTTLVLRLLQERAAQGHRVTVLDPHARFDQWQPWEVCGAGMDWRSIREAIESFCNEIRDHYQAIARGPAPEPSPHTVLAEEVTKWADNVANADRLIKTSCGDIRKANRFLVMASHGSTLDTTGGAKGFAKVIEQAALRLLLDESPEEIGAAQGWLYRPGNPEPIRVAIDRWAPTPAIAAAATASAIPGVNATHFALEWDLREAIELPHQTIAKAEVKQEILDLVLKALDGRSNWFSMAQIKQLRRPLQRVDDADLKSVLDAAVTMGDLEIDQSGAIPKYRLSNV